MTEQETDYQVIPQNNNPFGSEVKPPKELSTIAGAEQQRAIAEIQSAMVIAKRFPRDQMAAMDRILQACTRPTLAEGALYSYSKGGSEVTGPSIRLAEAIAQAWGNMQFGIRELDQRDGESTVEAYAWDIESNTRQVKVFHVKHVRKTRQRGVYSLDDPRDIYELTANQGARRLRACILGTVPGDVVEAAVKQCEETLKASCDNSPDNIKKMVASFEVFKVTPEMIKKRIQCHIEAIRPAQIVQLGKIYQSLHDGMSKASDWFEVAPEDLSINDKIKSAVIDTEKKDVSLGKQDTSKKENSESSTGEQVSTAKTEASPEQGSPQSETEKPPWHPDNHKRLRWQGLVTFAANNKDTWPDADRDHQENFLAKWSKVVGFKAGCPVVLEDKESGETEPEADQSEEEIQDPLKGQAETGRTAEYYGYLVDQCQSKISLNEFVTELKSEIDERDDSDKIWDLVNARLEILSVE